MNEGQGDIDKFAIIPLYDIGVFLWLTKTLVLSVQWQQACFVARAYVQNTMKNMTGYGMPRPTGLLDIQAIHPTVR